MSDEPDIIDAISRQLTSAGAAYAVAQEQRDDAIRVAVSMGLSERWIGERVGLSGPRINQIKKELADG